MMGLFRAAHGWDGGDGGGGAKKPSLPKIFYVYPTMMKVDTLIP